MYFTFCSGARHLAANRAVRRGLWKEGFGLRLRVAFL